MDSIQRLTERIEGFRKQKLSLDMTRGKPGPEQLDICDGMLTVVDENNFHTPSALDVRNYGGLDGFPEAKQLFADFLEGGSGHVDQSRHRNLACKILGDRIHRALCDLPGAVQVNDDPLTPAHWFGRGFRRGLLLGRTARPDK